MSKTKHGGRGRNGQPADPPSPRPAPEYAAEARVPTPPRALDLIRVQALFAGVPSDTLDPLVARCEIRQLETGDILLAPGQPNQDLFLLLAGQLEVHIDRVDSTRDFLIVPGECTGEISMVDGKPATAFVVAGEPCQVLVIPEHVLWDDLLRIPRIARNFMRLFADRFRARNQVMQDALEQQLRYEHLQKELAIAHDIQVGMLPRNLELEPAIELAAVMQPAHQIGGDFYDAFPVGRDEYCIAIGDVSGKGVPAALFMVRTLTLLRAEVLKNQAIDEALRNINLTLYEDNPTCMFATLLVGILDKHSGDFRYVNAGHDPVIVGNQGVTFRALPPPCGILVGLDDSAAYEVAALTLAPGDLLLFYTDGVTEAMNRNHELFGANRLMECLRRTPAISSRELADRITREVLQFIAGTPPSDDLTMLVARFRGV